MHNHFFAIFEGILMDLELFNSCWPCFWWKFDSKEVVFERLCMKKQSLNSIFSFCTHSRNAADGIGFQKCWNASVLVWKIRGKVGLGRIWKCHKSISRESSSKKWRRGHFLLLTRLKILLKVVDLFSLSFQWMHKKILSGNQFHEISLPSRLCEMSIFEFPIIQ